MKIDFHTHGKLAKYLPFSTVYTDWLLNQAKEAGLDAICLTEHFNTQQFEDLYQYIQQVGCPKGDSFVMENGLQVFTGMETDIAQGGHVLCIGPVQAILQLNRQLKPHMEKGSFLPFDELLALFGQYPVLVGAAHPYRQGGNIPQQPEHLLRQLDFLDLNGKDVAQSPQMSRQLIMQLAQRIGCPVVSGSDTHQAVQYGCIATCFNGEASTVQQLQSLINGGDYTIQVAPNAVFLVKTATLLKRTLKEVHALGGDYVQLLLREGGETPAVLAAKQKALQGLK